MAKSTKESLSQDQKKKDCTDPFERMVAFPGTLTSKWQHNPLLRYNVPAQAKIILVF